MPDLLSSLAAAHGSQESFHSTHSSPEIDNDHPAADLHTKAMQLDGLPVYDVEAFLNDPNNQLLLTDQTSATKRKAAKSSQIGKTGNSSLDPEPIELGGPRSSEHVKQLHEVCQRRGLQQPEFEYEGEDSCFSGSLTINGETISTDQKFRSKKDVKEALAKLGVETARRMPQNAGPIATKAGGDQTNWIGRLLEYYNATTPMQGPAYKDYGVGQFFACVCVVPNNPTEFGGKQLTFSSKKAARVNAARMAVQSLIDADLVESDGSLKVSRKKVKLGTAVKVENTGIGVKKNTTYAQRVNDLCPILGLTPPTYHMTALSLDAPNIVSGSAVFPTSPLFPKPIGEVRNVFGKKNAKEECAKEVFKALSDLARSRGIKVNDDQDDSEMVS